MIFKRFSMRVGLILTIAIVGILGMLLVYVAGNRFAELAIHNERAALKEQLHYMIADLRPRVHDAIDLVGQLESSETASGLLLRASDADGTVLYQSVHWPAIDIGDAALIAESDVPLTGAVRDYVTVAIAKDERAFYTALEKTRTNMLAFSAGLLLAVMAIVTVLVERNAIRPLRALTEHIRRVRQDKNYLRTHVHITGNAEVSELAAGLNEMTTWLEQMYADLERLAFTDVLTELPNRASFHSSLERAIAEARRDHSGFAVCIMDLDGFKDINDTLGHHVGDALLRQVAERLRTCLRVIDTVARMGGDEFAVLLPAVTPKEAETAARMLVQSLRAPFAIEGYLLDIGMSVGIALCPEHGIDPHILLQRADVAMYVAKRAAAGHACYQPHMDQHYSKRLAFVSELRQALAKDQFVLYFQPKVDLVTERAIGIEALVRWRHPNGELVLPEKFISLCEQTGLIRSLSIWVLNAALHRARELHAQGYHIPISINISVRDLQNVNLPEEFAEQIALHQVAPEWLELEITESAIMTDAPAALDVLTRLSAMGFKLAIDDFGTGYSSFAYLKKLPVHAVKIDKSFVSGMAGDENDAAIVRTSIELAHHLGIEVVAEGVDDKGVLARLKALRCDVAQGNYISRPLLPEELIEWLAKSDWGPIRRVSYARAVGKTLQ